MSNTITKQNVIFTPEDIHKLFKINERLSDIQDDMSKYHAVTDIFVEALASCKQQSAIPDEEIFFWVASVLRDYSEKALSEMCETFNKYTQMFTEKKDVCFGGVAI